MENKTSTIIAPLTSGSGGSISALRISGPKAFYSTSVLTKGTISEEHGGQHFLRTIYDAAGQAVDEVVILVYTNPNSFTGENVVEVNCHANPIVQDTILQLFLEQGCVFAEPGEFSRRAFLNGKIDLVQAEAIAGMISARSAGATRNALYQLKGRLSNKLKEIKSEIIKITSFLELDLDFSEEDIEIISAGQVDVILSRTIQSLKGLLESFRFSKVFTHGLEVLITGKPNVGKSSLMNAILDQDRVIVSDLPGTTRDIVQEQTIIGDTLVKLTDSAGIHNTENFIEAEGIERARGLFQNSDVILLVLDHSESFTSDDLNLLKTLYATSREKAVLLLNKTDKPAADNSAVLKNYELITLEISAKTGQGISHLKQTLLNKYIRPSQPDKEGLQLTNQRQYDYLKRTSEALIKARESLQREAGFEFVALDMREAIQNLSVVTGEISSEDILNTIFASFCIGK